LQKAYAASGGLRAVGIAGCQPAANVALEERRRRRAMLVSILQRIEHQFIDIAPAPLFSGLEGPDDWVGGCMKMFCGVFVW
jgi:hypothetical protein